MASLYSLTVLQEKLGRNILDYINDNLEVDDIFSEDQIKDYINSTFSPEEVYSEDRLIDWATENGYTKE